MQNVTNSIGMRLRRIDPGAFTMGASSVPLPDELAGKPHRRNGDPDEHPSHRVRITTAFYVGVTQITNSQFEAFDPEHRHLRGKLGFSAEDDEAVVFVSWHEAIAYCGWLSRREGKTYRLPTEAEWEYACRAGTESHFHTGDSLPDVFLKNPQRSWYPDPARSRDDEIVSLRVGETPPNAWGLNDMHGNVEEWCSDWYGPYVGDAQTDPIGYASGDFRVTRGGSHGTELYYLRSANRSGALPDDRHWLIGFRVVLGEPPSTRPLGQPGQRFHQIVGSQAPRSRHESADDPVFLEPREYVRIAPGSEGPLFSHHNHDPAIVACDNGDLLAVWYTCVEEPGRELGQAASRLRADEDEWTPADVFWNAPDRNDHAPALWNDGKGTLCHFAGLSAAATWGNLATVLRRSSDHGATWTKARIIIPEHGIRHMPVQSVSRTRDGSILLPCDAVTGGSGGTALWISDDDGGTWRDAGGTIAGIHAGIVELSDGRLLAFGRSDNVDGWMPQSVSTDRGATWQVSASPFQPIGGGQRLVLLRLREGPLFFASFCRDMPLRDASGEARPVSGLFGALSFDEGVSWATRRLISDDGPGRTLGTTNGAPFTMSASEAEPRGYLAVCQDASGIVHLISSRLHYGFNLEWLRTLPPAL